MAESPELSWPIRGSEAHFLVQVTEVMLVGATSAAGELIGAAGVRRKLHLCHLQPVGEVDHPTALKLVTTHTHTHTL